MITKYTSPKVAEPRPNLWSNCIVCDGIAYIAGLTSRNADGVTIDGADEYEQSKIIFKKHKALIESAGGKMSDFTKLTIFVTRIKNNKQVWKARAEFFKDNFPACSLVELSNLAEPNIYVEIEGIAHIGKGPFLINHRGSIYYYFINFRLNCRPKNYYYKKYNKNR